MRDSGVAWIGEVPEGWEVKRVKYVGEVHSAKTKPSKNAMPRYVDEFAVNDEVLGQNDVLVTGCVGTIGKIHKANHNSKEACHDNRLLITPSNAGLIEYNYMYWAMQVVNYDEITLRTAMPFITATKLLNQPIVIPPLSEQRRIADFLDSRCTRIDDMVENLAGQVKGLKEYKKNLIHKAVTKGLDKDVPTKDSGVEWIGEVPEGWGIKKIKYVAEERLECETMNPGTDTYIGLENVTSYFDKLVKTDSEYAVSKQKKCYKGDVLFSKLRPYLAKSIIPEEDCFCTGEFIDLCGFEGDVRFLRYSMLNPGFINEINTTTYGVKMPRTNSVLILNEVIPYPPLPDQRRIAEYLDRKCSKIDALIENYESQIKAYTEYKKSLIYEYVTGKKRISA